MSDDEDGFNNNRSLKRSRRAEDSSSDEEDQRSGFPSRYVGVSFQSGGVQKRQSDDGESENENENENEELDTPPRMGMGMGMSNSIMQIDASELQKPSNVHVKNYGIGAKLLGKMGYVPGRGLGSDGKGIVEPIQQKLRPTLLGLGAMDEKTKQAKKDEARIRKLKGIPDSDNEYESTKQTSAARRKPKNLYRTIKELESQGLRVPSGFKHIVDMTTRGNGSIVEDLSDIRLNDDTPTISLEDDKIALYDNARKQLHEFSQQWSLLDSRLSSSSAEMAILEKELDKTSRELTRLETLLELLDRVNANSNLQDFASVSNDLDTLQSEYIEDITNGPLKDFHVAVSALRPYFEYSLRDWSPLDYPTVFKAEIIRWAPMLGINIHDTTSYSEGDFTDLMYAVWFPKAQSSLTNDWQPTSPSAALLFLEEWEVFLPRSIKVLLVDQIIVPKLERAINDWRPSSSEINVDISRWLLPWIQYLDAPRWEHLVVIFSHKLASIFKAWSPQKTSWMISGVKKWREIVGSDKTNKLLSRNLVHRLEEYLHRHFVVDRSCRNTEPLTEVLKWTDELDLSSIGRILENEFFPKWQNVLYQWLVSAGEDDLSEIASWYETWAEWFPPKVSEIAAVKAGFEQCLDLINKALDEDRRNLKKPEFKPLSQSTHSNKAAGVDSTSEQLQSQQRNSPSFKDLVADYCADNDLFLISLRKPHPVLGYALFKISDNPAGHSGITCYIKDDVLWATSRDDRKTYLPISLDELQSRL